MNKESNEKIKRLFLEYARYMIKEAFYILRDYNMSEDAVSDAFIKIMENLEKIDEDNFYKTRKFCIIVVRNIAINMYNRRKKF